MPARVDQRLTGSSRAANSSGTITNGAATATFAAAASTKHYVQRAVLTAKGTIAAGVRATLTWTYNGDAQTAGFQIPIGFSQLVLDFGNNPIEGDSNTAITLSMPALGASGDGEACIFGFSTKD